MTTSRFSDAIRSNARQAMTRFSDAARSLDFDDWCVIGDRVVVLVVVAGLAAMVALAFAGAPTP